MVRPVPTSHDQTVLDGPSGLARASIQNPTGIGDPTIPSASRHRRREGDVLKRGQQSAVICDRNLLFRAGLVHALDKSDFQVVAECSIIDDVSLTTLPTNLPIMLLIGLDLSRIGAIKSTLRDLRRRYSSLSVIMFHDNDWTGPVAPEMAEIGHLVDAILSKDGIDSDSVLKALDLVLLGASVVSKEFSQHVVADGDHTAAPPQVLAVDPDLASGLVPTQLTSRWAHLHATDSLTVREKLILSHLMKGASNKAIARDVGIAESTVKIHVRNLMLKIDAKNRTQAAMWGYKNLA
jgi:two-component system nitrate/nitrite response regulator NarL